MVIDLKGIVHNCKEFFFSVMRESLLLLASLRLLAVLAVDGVPGVADVSATVGVPMVPAGACIFAVVFVSLLY
jgi:hypothetical protein